MQVAQREIIHILLSLKKVALVTRQYYHSDGENLQYCLYMNHCNVSHTKHVTVKLIFFNRKHNLQCYSKEISAKKTKLMTNNASGINTEIKVNGQKLETVTSFKYLGSVITDEGSKPEILSRVAQTTAALTRLKPVLNDRSISLSSKIQLMRSHVTSIFLYAFESWTLTAELQRRIQAMEIRCYRKILHISYKDHVTNEEVHVKIQRQSDHTKTS